MSSHNKVLLMGNLTRDPEVRFTQSGLGICNLGLALNEKVKSGEEWVEKTTFVDVTIFGKRGESFAKFHKKGTLAFIEGKLRLDQWEDKQSGQKRSKLFVVADSWEFVSGGHDKQDRETEKNTDTAGKVRGIPTYDDETPF